MRRLELPQLTSLEPKSSVSTNSTTSAFYRVGFYLYHTLGLVVPQLNRPGLACFMTDRTATENRQMEPTLGIEPRIDDYKSTVIPFNYAGRKYIIKAEEEKVKRSEGLQL